MQMLVLYSLSLLLLVTVLSNPTPTHQNNRAGDISTAKCLSIIIKIHNNQYGQNELLYLLFLFVYSDLFILFFIITKGKEMCVMQKRSIAEISFVVIIWIVP